MFAIIFSWLAEQMPFLKENALGQNKAIFIQNILFSNCADSGLHKIYFQCKGPTFLGKDYKQNGAGRQAEDKVLRESTMPRASAVQETTMQVQRKETRQRDHDFVWGSCRSTWWALFIR